MRRSVKVLAAAWMLAACNSDIQEASSDGSDTNGDTLVGDGDGDGAESGSAEGDGDPGDGDPGDGDPGDGDPGDGDPGDGDGDPGDGDPGDGDGDPVEPDPLWVSPNLWYSVEDRLIYIEIDPTDGSVVQLVTSTITTALIDGQNGLTMLEDGSLVGSRESEGETQIFHVPDPPTVASMIPVDILGVVPDQLRIEALYTDCDGRVYLMDTGTNVSSAEGNRLLRFTGDYLGGDLAYEVITDLQMAQVADIDDMGPGIDDMGEVTDGVGFAIDSGDVYEFNYTTGTGNLIGAGGTWGVHVLGGPLFDDDTARLYLLNSDAELFEADPGDLNLSPVLVTGPTPAGDAPPGWSGLAGPLTECTSTLPEPQ